MYITAEYVTHWATQDEAGDNDEIGDTASAGTQHGQGDGHTGAAEAGGSEYCHEQHLDNTGSDDGDEEGVSEVVMHPCKEQ